MDPSGSIQVETVLNAGGHAYAWRMRFNNGFSTATTRIDQIDLLINDFTAEVLRIKEATCQK